MNPCKCAKDGWSSIEDCLKDCPNRVVFETTKARLFVGETACEKLGKAAFARIQKEAQLEAFNFFLTTSRPACWRILATVKPGYVGHSSTDASFAQARAWLDGYMDGWWDKSEDTKYR